MWRYQSEMIGGSIEYAVLVLLQARTDVTLSPICLINGHTYASIILNDLIRIYNARHHVQYNKLEDRETFHRLMI